jgi:GH15 family glucan-1,4-alpha-glucosidase
MSSTPIADYALLSDRHSRALVSRDGSVDWLGFPRFDSPAVFARLLDDQAGHWRIHPVDEAQTSRRYLDRTMVLETTFTTESGQLVLTDAMALGPDHGEHRLGRDVPHLRAVEFANDVGLLAEEVDETTGELLGNFPQAFSHIGLVNAAWAISEALGTDSERTGGLS